MVSEREHSARSRDAEAELRDRTLFFAEVEHKMKTAMSVLQGWAVTLDERWDGLSPEARRDGISTIRRAADGLVSQTDRMLEEARSELLSLDLQRIVLDLSEVAALTARAHRSATHELVADGPEPVLAPVDPAALQQVLGHLVENAVKYSPDGGTITLRTGQADGWATVEVSDEGVGLQPGDDERIFEPFQRGAAAPFAARPGVGLGLYIVRKLVDAMGGTVAAHGNDGRGTTFRVRLPLS